MDKYVKLEAISKIAKPMGAFHGKNESEEESDMKEHGCKCVCCGAPCDICQEADSEHEDEDMSEEDSDEEY